MPTLQTLHALHGPHAYPTQTKVNQRLLEQWQQQRQAAAATAAAAATTAAAAAYLTWANLTVMVVLAWANLTMMIVLPCANLLLSNVHALACVVAMAGQCMT